MIATSRDSRLQHHSWRGQCGPAGRARWALKASAHSVVRKEDRRFITGKGRYVDDVKVLGLTHAHFVRSPHAHAKVKGIDTSAAKAMPGVVDVLIGQQIVDDKVGNLICGWAHHLEGRHADEDGRMAGDGAGSRCASSDRPSPW